MLKKLLLSLFLMSSPCYGEWDIQAPDDFAREHLKWGDVQTAKDISDYTMYASIIMPWVSVVKNQDKSQAIGTAAAQLSVALTTEAVKRIAGRVRPDGRSTKSFFSGHTSGAFAGAGAVCSYEGKEACYTALALATTTGYMRIAGDRHWLSDVLVGALVGYAGGRHLTIMVGTNL